jgi:hypothetical protein
MRSMKQVGSTIAATRSAGLIEVCQLQVRSPGENG